MAQFLKPYVTEDNKIKKIAMSSAWEVTRNLGLECKQWESRTEKRGSVNMETPGKDNQEKISSTRIAQDF